ncbi:PREDICTED: WD repeat-containing protein 18 [Ceratosolen solmsi marchali]|uniref:WD repeat-containing protein 18 n=1 Tax=Ceratosolen solmsi marchali TaxID=326594 RepID=A0AAJ6VKX3_9HYME|nr:PREDICTED: WD repeat-containing protein 18 [Ceratosolen solmsi marchali]
MRCPHEVIVTCDSSNENWSAATWDPCTGSLSSTYKHAGTLGHHSLQLLKDSYLIASSATKPILHLWPLNSQTPIQFPRLATPGRVTALSCTPNGSYIAAAINEKIYIWQSCNGLLINSFARHYQTISCLIFNKDGSCLASGAEDGLIFVWLLSQLTNEKEVKSLSSFSHHSLPVKDLYFGKVGCFGRLCSVSLDRSARIYDIHAGLLLLTLIFDIPLVSVCMDIMENNLFVGSSTGLVMMCNLRHPPRGIEHHVSSKDNDKLKIFKGHESGITALSVSIDNITLLTGSLDGFVYLWDILSSQIILTLKHKAPIISAFFATAYDNFTTNNFKPSLQVRSLHKVSNAESKNNFLEVCKRDQDDSWLLDFDSQSSNGNRSRTDSDDSKDQLNEALSEIERLKKINSDLYEYSVRNIFDSKSNSNEV